MIGADLIRNIPYLAGSADLVRDAHERMDGLGYPDGRHAAEVALGARIIAVADAYDAMTRPRVFRDAISHDEAILEIRRCAGLQFDPRRRRRFNGSRSHNRTVPATAPIRVIRGLCVRSASSACSAARTSGSGVP